LTRKRYGQSKTANILFAVELNRRYKSQGLIANALHPGYIQTDLQRHMSIPLSPPSSLLLSSFIYSLWHEKDESIMAGVMKIPGMELSMKFSMLPKTPQQGAATSLYAALSPDVADGGKYVSSLFPLLSPLSSLLSPLTLSC
jgi:NAD(P)-dependent dehydrogenase (short-subunit alcohol dehydrogenase family)